MPNAIVLYRIARWCYLRRIPAIPKLIRLYLFIIHNSRIPYRCEIGKGTFFIVKGIGVVIHDRVKIGKNCRIGQHVSMVGKGPYKNVALIGNNVFIGAGSVIVGPIIVEDDVIIAPNTVVTKSIPKGCIVAGNPALVIGHVSKLEYNILQNSSYKEDYMDFLNSPYALHI